MRVHAPRLSVQRVGTRQRAVGGLCELRLFRSKGQKRVRTFSLQMRPGVDCCTYYAVSVHIYPRSVLNQCCRAACNRVQVGLRCESNCNLESKSPCFGRPHQLSALSDMLIRPLYEHPGEAVERDMTHSDSTAKLLCPVKCTEFVHLTGQSILCGVCMNSAE